MSSYQNQKYLIWSKPLTFDGQRKLVVEVVPIGKLDGAVGVVGGKQRLGYQEGERRVSIVGAVVGERLGEDAHFDALVGRDGHNVAWAAEICPDIFFESLCGLMHEYDNPH